MPVHDGVAGDQSRPACPDPGARRGGLPVAEPCWAWWAQTRLARPEAAIASKPEASGYRASSAYASPCRPSPPMHPLSQRYAVRRLIGAVVLAMLLGQWTVLTHSIAHTRLGPDAAAFIGVGVGVGVGADADADADADAGATATASADTDDSWGHHAGSSVCQLVDQLLIGQAVGGDPAASPCVPPDATRAESLARSIGPSPVAHAYRARGPPRT